MGKQVFLLLVDPGSSDSLLNAEMVPRLNLIPKEIPSQPVKVANRAYMDCHSIVSDFVWWMADHTFTHDMEVPDLGGYDGVLVMDWLSTHSPTKCHWQKNGYK